MFEDFPLDILIEISTYLELDEATTLFSVSEQWLTSIMVILS